MNAQADALFAMLDGLGAARTAHVNGDLLAHLQGTSQLLREWRALGPKMIVVTQGAQGATALIGAQAIAVAAPVVTVCDAVGAGDVFMAALLACMREDGALGHATTPLSTGTVARWLDFASRAAALCCARPGCDPPRRSEIMAER